MKKKLLLILCACIMLGGCGESIGQPITNEAPKQNVSASLVEEPNTSQEIGENFTGKVLGAGSEREIVSVTLTDEFQKAAYFADQVYHENQENTLVSPLSLEIALGLTYEGATGTTAEELQNYLGMENYADWVDEYVSYAEGLEVSGASNAEYSFAYELANSIWVKKDSKLTGDYVSRVKSKYRAEAQNVDFMGEAEKVAEKINAWCDQKTHGMIKQMVSPDMFNEKLEAILMNSIYFESPWIEEWGLFEHDFTNLKGEKETREMLRDCVEEYFENDKATAFAKDYYNGFEFIGILPKAEGEFELSDLDLKSLLASRTNNYNVVAVAPKMNFECTANNIVDVLKAQGIQQAFNKYQGMFTRMVEDKELYISDILQKCKIEMDDKGTRAAAVTAIIAYECESAEEPVMKETKKVYLDRPFAFLIYDRNHDKIVFAGKVVE